MSCTVKFELCSRSTKEAPIWDVLGANLGLMFGHVKIERMLGLRIAVFEPLEDLPFAHNQLRDIADFLEARQTEINNALIPGIPPDYAVALEPPKPLNPSKSTDTSQDSPQDPPFGPGSDPGNGGSY